MRLIVIIVATKLITSAQLYLNKHQSILNPLNIH